MAAATFTALFTTAGTFTWVAPAGVTSAEVQCWAGGGGGGGTNGGGGGGGEYAAEPSNTVVAGDSYTVVVGAAGVAGTTTGTGGNGGSSSFTGTSATTVTAHGGSGGVNNNAGDGAGGAAGTGSSNTGHENGGAGAGGTNAVSQGGGGGGGSGGTAAAGNTGSANSGTTGGAGATAVTGGGPGGTGGAGTRPAGTAGVAPVSGPGGGGGGGGYGTGSGSAGGAGFAGQVLVTWTMATPAVIAKNTTGGTYQWTAPAGITTVDAQAIGGGGAGGGATSTTSTTGGGGGGGEDAEETALVVTAGSSYTFTVGAAGAGAAGTTGGNGGNSTMAGDAVTVTAHGGTGGGEGTNGASGAGGTGSSNTAHENGGAGAAGTTNSYGGGGGSSAGTSAAGNAGSGATGGSAVTGGGPGGTGASSAGNGSAPGSGPGGGGGGARGGSSTRTGGAGFDGHLTLTWAANVTVSLTTPNVALAAPLVTVTAGAKVTLTAPNVALAAPLLTPGVGVQLTTPNLALAAPLPAITAGAKVTLTAPNLALAAPLLTPEVPFDVLPAAPDPLAPLDARVELDLDGWTDISEYVQKDQVVIGRGHPDESTTTTASTLAMTLCNTDGRFSSKNPTGPYYGYLGRNARCRISFPEGASYLRIEEDQASYAQCPDSAGVSITGDMDLQLDLTLDNWRANQILAAKWAETGSEQTWKLLLEQNGSLVFVFSSDGSSADATNSSQFGGAGQVPYPPLGRLCVRVTFASSTGTVKFYTAPPGNLASATWTQLGDTSVFGSESLFNSTAPVQVGWCSDDAAGDPGYTGISGKVHAMRLLSGISGTAKASPDFTAQAAGTTSFADAQTNTWTLEGTSEVSDRKYRFHGEIAGWPQAQDPSGKTVYCSVSGGGLLRRTGQAQASLSSAMTRAYIRLPAADQLAAFWPAEDGANATSIASGIGGTPMVFSGTPALASSTVFACTSALPVMNGAIFTGSVSSAGITWNANVVRFLWAPPASQETNGALIARVVTTGTIKRLDLQYGTANAGSLALSGYDITGNQLFTTAYETFNVDGGLWRVSLEMVPDGSGGVSWAMATVAPGAADGLVFSGDYSSASIGAVTSVQFGSPGIVESVMGEFSVQATDDTLFDLGSPLDAWLGEAAGDRFARLCGEEGFQFRGRGDLSATAPMGLQTQQTLVALLQECVDADLGIMWELRQQLGFGYRTRTATGNMAAGVTLSYNADHLDIPTSPPLEDDQTTVNDVTVTQTSDGSLARQFAQAGQPIDGGSLSIDDPPDGIGRYDQQYQVNLAADSQLMDNAGWRLHMGTVDEPRYPGIGVDLANAALATYWYPLLDLDIGDRLAITDAPAWLPPGTIDQVLNGLQETFFVRGILAESFQGIPYSPWCSATASGDAEGLYGHADTDGSTLHADITSTATSMSVATASGAAIWTTSAGNFPFDVLMAGERMTVTNITGTSSPQTFTVTRSVNSVVKAQSAGTPLALYHTPVAAL